MIIGVSTPVFGKVPPVVEPAVDPVVDELFPVELLVEESDEDDDEDDPLLDEPELLEAALTVYDPLEFEGQSINCVDEGETMFDPEKSLATELQV